MSVTVGLVDSEPRVHTMPGTGKPLLPGDDPFYRAPAGIDHLALGTVLRSRAVEVALFGVVPQKVSAWQLLYRTNDLHGAPQVAVTTVLLPWDADPTAARPLLSYQCAIDAVAARCFPSYALRRGPGHWGPSRPGSFCCWPASWLAAGQYRYPITRDPTGTGERHASPATAHSTASEQR